MVQDGPECYEMRQRMPYSSASSGPSEMVTRWNVLLGPCFARQNIQWGLTSLEVGLRRIESHTCQALKPRRAWYSGRHGGLAAIINSSVTAVLVSWPPSKFPGTRLALDVLALPQLACFPACHFPASAILASATTATDRYVPLARPNFFLHPRRRRRGPHFFLVRTCREQNRSFGAHLPKHLPQSPKQPQPREVQPPTSSTTALPNFATTTSPSHPPQSWRPLTCPAFSTPPARTLSCSWPPSPTSAPRTCRFT